MLKYDISKSISYYICFYLELDKTIVVYLNLIDTLFKLANSKSNLNEIYDQANFTETINDELILLI